MEASSWLASKGLTGPYQVHCDGTVLTVDLRAHQVFLGFQDDVHVISCLLRRYLPSAKVVTEHAETTLGELTPTDLFVLPACSDSPGGFYGLVHVVDRLVGPDGCPWDIEQTHATLKKYLVEEAYELMQAIDAGDVAAMKEELGDVLLQPLMHSQKKQLEGVWGIDEVAQAITEKLVRRHPHVFCDAVADTPEQVLKNWDSIKRSEKSGAPTSTLAGIPLAMPALLRAMEVSKRAARAGFEWPDFESVWDKFHEEEREVRSALQTGSREEIAGEFGDLLFTVVNLARWAKVDPEDALRTMVDRFTTRFMSMESQADKPLTELTPSEWDELWNKAKAQAENTAR